MVLPKLTMSFFHQPQSLLIEVNDYAGTDSKVVLVVVASVIEGGQKVIGLDKAR